MTILSIQDGIHINYPKSIVLVGFFTVSKELYLPVTNDYKSVFYFPSGNFERNADTWGFNIQWSTTSNRHYLFKSSNISSNVNDYIRVWRTTTWKDLFGLDDRDKQIKKVTIVSKAIQATHDVGHDNSKMYETLSIKNSSLENIGDLYVNDEVWDQNNHLYPKYSFNPGYVDIPSSYENQNTTVNFVYTTSTKGTGISCVSYLTEHTLTIEYEQDVLDDSLKISDSVSVQFSTNNLILDYTPPGELVVPKKSIINITSNNNVLNNIDVLVEKTHTTSFATTAENWLVSSNWVFNSSEGNPPGSEVFTVAGRNAAGTGNLYLTRTWEQLGITPGTVVDSIRLESIQYKVIGYNVVDYLRIFPIEVRKSNDTVIGTLQTQVTKSSLDASYVTVGPSSYITIPTDTQTSTSTVKLNIYAEGDTGSNKDAIASVAVDNIIFKVREKVKVNLTKLKIKDSIHAHLSSDIRINGKPFECFAFPDFLIEDFNTTLDLTNKWSTGTTYGNLLLEDGYITTTTNGNGGSIFLKQPFGYNLDLVLDITPHAQDVNQPQTYLKFFIKENAGGQKWYYQFRQLTNAHTDDDDNKFFSIIKVTDVSTTLYTGWTKTPIKKVGLRISGSTLIFYAHNGTSWRIIKIVEDSSIVGDYRTFEMVVHNKYKINNLYAVTLSPGMGLYEPTHSVTSDGNLLLNNFTIDVSNCRNYVSSDSVILITDQQLSLTIQDSNLSIISDNLNLIQNFILSVENSLHTLDSENIDISLHFYIIVEDALHHHEVEELAITYIPPPVLLVLEGGNHSISSDNLILTHSYTVVTEDSLHSLSSDNLDLGISYTLTVEESNHTLLSTEPILTTKYSVVTDDSLHLITDNFTEIQSSYTFSVEDSLHTVSSIEINLTPFYGLNVESSTHSISSAELVLNTFYFVIVENSLISVLSDSPDLLQNYQLVLESSHHEISSDNVEISSNYLLTVDSSNHALISDQVDLIQHNSLITQSSLHTLTSDYVNLEAVVVLIINSSDHVITSDNAEITSKYLLTLDDTLHTFSSENVQLESKYILIVESSIHSLSETIINLNSNYVLTVNNSLHTVDSDNITLDSNYVLSIEDSTHTILSNNIELSSYYNLIVEDSSHSQVSDTIDISVFYDIIVQDTTHSILSDNLALIQHYILVIDSTNHEIVSDEVNFTGSYLLVISDSTHNITSTNLTLQTSSLNLTVEDSSHTLISDNLDLITSYVLSIYACNHDLSSNNVVLESSYVLTLEDSLINITSENVILTQFIQLNIENSLHTLNSEEPTLQSKYVIVIGSCNHSVISETINIYHKYTFIVNYTQHLLSSEVPTLSSHYILSLVFFGHHTITSDTPKINSFSLQSGETYKLKVKFTGNNIVVSIDGINKFIFDEASFNNTETKFGIKSVENNTILKNRLDNFKVSK
jgi:hypothetical protein